MEIQKKIFAAALVIVIFFHFVPKLLLAKDLFFAVNTSITEHPIESTSTPDETISVEKEAKSNLWLWSLLGVVIVGGAAAAAGGGSGGGGGGGGDDSPSTGTIPVQW